jgi:hypothetical protein
MADSLVKLLNKLGYQPVFLPRAGISPPEIYNFANGHLVRRGPLAGYLPAGVQVPPTKKDRLADIEYKETSTKKLSAAISFLGNALRCIGITSPPKIDLSFTGTTDFAFSFTDVTYEAVDPAAIDQLIKTLSLGAIPNEYVEAGKLHIAYDYAYAQSLSMRRADGEAFSHDVTGASIGAYLDLGTSGEAKAQSETTITFKNSAGVGAAFAYKAGQLTRTDDRWEFYPEEVMRHGFLPDESGVANAQPFLPTRGVVLSVTES